MTGIPAWVLLATLTRTEIWRVFPLQLILLIFFFATFVKTCYFLHLTMSDSEELFRAVSSPAYGIVLQAFSIHNIVDALFVSMLALAAVAGTAALCQGMRWVPQAAPQLPRLMPASANRLATALLFAGVFITIVTAWIGIKFGIGFMGREDVERPFKLTAIQNYARTFPQWIFLLVLAIGLGVRSLRITIAGVAALSFYSVLISYTSGGRGTFTLVIILVAPLLAIYRFGKMRWLVWGGVLLLFSSLMHPIFDRYRQIRTGEEEIDQRESFRLANSTTLESGEGVIGILATRLKTIVFRLGGIDSLVFFTMPDQVRGSPLDTLGVALGTVRVERIFTDDMLQASAAAGRSHSAAPTLIGLFYYLGGSVFVFCGFALTTVVFQGLYAWLANRVWLVTPLVLCKLINVVLDVIPGGVVGNLSKEIVVFAIFMVILEFFARHLCPDLGNQPSTISHSLSHRWGRHMTQQRSIPPGAIAGGAQGKRARDVL